MVFVAPPITKVEKPFNLLEGAESLPKNKIAVFNYEIMHTRHGIIVA